MLNEAVEKFSIFFVCISCWDKFSKMLFIPVWVSFDAVNFPENFDVEKIEANIFEAELLRIRDKID